MTQKNKFNATVAAVIAATLAAVSLMAGCGSNNGDNKETKVVSETQIVTRVVNGVFTDEDGNILKDKDGQPLTAPSGTPDSDSKEKSEKSDNNNSGSNDSKSEEKSENGNSGSGESKSEEKKSDDNKSEEKKKEPEKQPDDGNDKNDLKLGGKSFEIGDEVVCTYKLTCPTKFINYQATLNYDSDLLKVTDAEMLGSASGGSVINFDLSGKVKFNGIKLNGYNYSSGGDFLTVTYKVLDSGSADPKISWEIVTDTNNNAMVVNGEPVSEFKIEEEYK